MEMTFSSPNAKRRPARMGAGNDGAPSRLTRVHFSFQSSKFKVQSSAVALLLLVFGIIATPCYGANVRLYFQARTNTSVLLTNTVIAVPTSGNTLANGVAIPTGIPFRINFAANGYTTNFFAAGYYALTNNLLGQGGIVIRVDDNGSQLYDYTNLLWSGFNNFVGIWGTNLPPTYDGITNALGFLPITPAQLAAATNAFITAAQSTNIAAYQAMLATNAATIALGARIIATNNAILATVTNIANNLQAQITAATNVGITASTATNIAAYQAQIATNNFRITSTNIARAIASTNNSSGNSAGATNIYPGGIIGGLRIYKNDTDGAVGFVGEETTSTNLVINWQDGGGIYAPNFYGLSDNLTNAAGFNLAGLNYITATTNGLSARLIATNTANLVITTNVANVVSNGLSARLIATNSALVTRITDATNDLNTTLVAADTVVSNGLSARLIATNANAFANVTNHATVISNGLSARLIATNDLLLANVTNHVTVASNGLSARVIATNAALVTRITDATNNLNTTFGTRLIATNNLIIAYIDAQSGGGSATNAIGNLNGKGTNTTLYFDQAAWGTNHTLNGSTANFIAGGRGHIINSGNRGSTIVGGETNYMHITSSWLSMFGGISNSIYFSDGSGIFGGAFNYINNSSGNPGYSTIVGGFQNLVTGGYSLAGGYSNIASGRYSVALGSKAVAGDEHTFVFSDGTIARSTTNSEASFFVTNGLKVNTSITSDRQITTNLNLGGWDTLQWTTNVIASTIAGSLAARGNFQLVNSSHYTNKFSPGVVITNNTAGNWQIKSNTVVLYSSTLPVGDTWTIQSGASPVPITYYGSYLLGDGVVIQGVINSTNLTARLATIGITSAQATNIAQAISAIAPDGYGTASTNLASIGFAGPKHMNQGQMLYTALKIASRGTSFNLPGVIAIFGFGDNGIPATTGSSFQYVIHNGFSSFLPWAGSIFGGTRADGGLNYSVGTCTQNSAAGSGSAVWQGPWFTYATGQTATNAHTGITGITATHLVLNPAQANGWGSFQIYTQSAGVSAMSLFRTVNNDNAGSFTPYSTNIWLGSRITNCVAAIVSTGTNLTYGQLACGLYDTNGPGYIFDDLFGSGADMLFAMTNSAHSNAYRVLMKPYFDGILVSDLNTSNSIYQGTKLWTEMMTPTTAATSWRTDLILMSGSPTTNSATTADIRLAFNRACLDFNVAGFDSYGLFGTDPIARLFSLVPLNDVHFTNYVGRMIGTKFVDWAGWSYGHQMQNGYTIRDTSLNSLNYVALTNGIAYGTFTINPANDRLVVFTNYTSGVTAMYMGHTPGTPLGAASYLLYSDSSGVVNLNAASSLWLRQNNNPQININSSGGMVFGDVFGDQTDPGYGNARFNLKLASKGTLFASNTIAMSTNYTVGNFTPISGFVTLVASNNSGYSTALSKTNLIVAP